jgi:hypothetical protein
MRRFIGEEEPQFKARGFLFHPKIDAINEWENSWQIKATACARSHSEIVIPKKPAQLFLIALCNHTNVERLLLINALLVSYGDDP